VSDAHHFPRAFLAAQIAVGGSGSQVIPLVASGVIAPGSWRQWPVWRDALRLELWRLSGSTATQLNAPLRASKIQACGLSVPNRLAAPPARTARSWR
jgi:hypothetical protein